MYFEIAVAAIIVGTYVYHRWIEDHPAPAPIAVGTPRVDEGSPIPLIYGTCRVRAPILAWAGGQRTPKIRGQRFAYFVDMLYVVGIPFYGGGAELVSIYAGDVPLTLNPASSYPFTASGVRLPSLPRWADEGIAFDRRNYWVRNTPASTFDDPTSALFTSFTGDGFVEFHTGTPTQRISDGIDDFDKGSLTDTQAVLEVRPMNDMYVYQTDTDGSFATYPDLPEDIQPSDMPSYRNQAIACLYKWCNGDSTQLRNYNFVVRSLSTGTASYLGRSLAGDADPAAVVIDLLTSSWGKLALPMSKIDIPSFNTASATLFSEAHGYSRSIEQATDATEVLGDIMRQTDGVYYEEPTTGKIVYKLIRNDYNVLTLLDVNPDNARRADGAWISVQGQAETMNQVRVTFTDDQNDYADGLAIAQDFANIVSQGNKLRSVDIRFPGCRGRQLAGRLAARELAAVSRTIVKASVIGNRTFSSSRLGDAVTFTWPPLGIDHMVMRIASINFGTLRDGAIRLDLVRDIFDVSNGAFPVAT